MKAYTQVYLDHFGYTIADYIECEACGAHAVDIHHIQRRGRGGNSEADTIDNLMALCRACHIKYGDKKQFKDYLKDIHNRKLHNPISMCQ